MNLIRGVAGVAVCAGAFVAPQGAVALSLADADVGFSVLSSTVENGEIVCCKAMIDVDDPAGDESRAGEDPDPNDIVFPSASDFYTNTNITTTPGGNRVLSGIYTMWASRDGDGPNSVIFDVEFAAEFVTGSQIDFTIDFFETGEAPAGGYIGTDPGVKELDELFNGFSASLFSLTNLDYTDGPITSALIQSKNFTSALSVSHTADSVTVDMSEGVSLCELTGNSSPLFESDGICSRRQQEEQNTQNEIGSLNEQFATTTAEFTVVLNTVPLPAAGWMLLGGLGGLGLLSRRRAGRA